MNSKLVYCKKQSDYTSHSFSDNQVIFIEETGEIITHGKSFGKGSGGGNVGSTKTMNINGASYNIATTSANLPTIYAPTVLGTAGYVLKTNTKGDGFVWEAEKTYSNFKGATETLNGASGLVPQPKINQRNYYLKGNGNWVKPSLSDFTDDVVSGNYLPLSGGTLKGKGDSVLTINRTDGWPLINFSSNTNIYGYLGVNNSKELVFLQYNQSEFYKILNSNNYSSYALPLSGGTITNEGTGIFINRTKANLNPHICFKSQGENVGDLGISYDGKPVFYDYTTGKIGWKVILHEGNYSSFALPLSGGTLTGHLTIKSTTASNYKKLSVGNPDGYNAAFHNSSYTSSSREASISWMNGTTTVGSIGVMTYPFYYDGTKVHKILHEGNWDSYALPLDTSTKYTVTSKNSGVVNFKSTSNIESGIRLYLGDTNGGGLWYNPSYGIYLYNGKTGKRLGIKDDGTPYLGDYTLYHTGNLNLSNYHAKGNELTIGDGTGSIVNLQIKGSLSAMSIMSFSNGTNYIESHTKDGDNAPLKITGNSANVGSDLYLYFSNIYCRGGNYVNLDSGNYSDYALPLSGGTLTDTLKIKQQIGLWIQKASTQTGVPYIRFGKYTANNTADNTTVNGELGVNDSQELVFYKGTSGGSWLKVWHEGNDGSGSGLDADKLDGMDSNRFWNAIPQYSTASDGADKTTAPTFLGYATGLSGFRYFLTTFYKSQTETSNRTQLALGYDSQSMSIRRYYGGKWYDWETIAFTSSNVASATKATQDGSGNVIATTYLKSSSYTAADVLTKLKGVDGANSGLDADQIDGYHISVTSSPGTNTSTIYFII